MSGLKPLSRLDGKIEMEPTASQIIKAGKKVETAVVVCTKLIAIIVVNTCKILREKKICYKNKNALEGLCTAWLMQFLVGLGTCLVLVLTEENYITTSQSLSAVLSSLWKLQWANMCHSEVQFLHKQY